MKDLVRIAFCLLTISSCTNKKESHTPIVMIDYYEDGKIKSRVEMNKDSILDGRMDTYYPNGNKEMTAFFVNEKVDGEMIRYYETGKVASIENYSKHIKNGLSVNYYESGNRRFEGYFYRGLEVGHQYEYFDNKENSLKYDTYIYLLGDKRKPNGTTEYNEKGEIIKQDPYVEFTELDQVVEIKLQKRKWEKMHVIIGDYDYLFNLKNKNSIDTLLSQADFTVKLPYIKGDTIRGYIDNYENFDDRSGVNQLIHFSYPDIWD